MHILIVGLGNPGKKYEFNRHNAGFMYIDHLIASSNKNNDLVVSENKKLQVTSYKLKTFTLIKPQTFMNLSGEAVKKIVKSYKLQVTNIVVVHDDLDIRIGNFKIQKGVGPKVHNGLKSIEQSLGTDDFWRIRIGIDNRNSDFQGSGESYVLSDFTKDELEILHESFKSIFSHLKALLK